MEHDRERFKSNNASKDWPTCNKLTYIEIRNFYKMLQQESMCTSSMVAAGTGCRTGARHVELEVD
jgi:hypothetical protein